MSTLGSNSRYAADKLREAAGAVEEDKPLNDALRSAASRPSPVTVTDVPDAGLWREYQQLTDELSQAANNPGSKSVRELNDLIARLRDLATRVELLV